MNVILVLGMRCVGIVCPMCAVLTLVNLHHAFKHRQLFQLIGAELGLRQMHFFCQAVGGGAALAAVIPGASAMGSCGPDDKTCKSNHTSDVNGYVDCKACVASGLGWSPVQVHPRPLRC